MLRKSALMVVFAVFLPVHSVRGQSSGDPATANNLVKVCNAYGESQVVFVGRAEPPVTFHIAGEPEIEKARQNVIRTEAEVAGLRASLDLKTRLEREREFEIALIQAKAELVRRRTMYPPPIDLTLIPVSVERAFRGVTEASLMLRLADPAMKMEPGELYLISGYRSKNLIPPFPEIAADLGSLDEYVDPARVTPVALAQQELQFLASTVSGATIIGTLRMHSYSDVAGDPLTGTQIAVSSGTHVVETMTRPDGSFIVSGIESGRLEIRPLLRDDLTVVNKSALTVQIGEGGCKGVSLTAALNGRLRGRIFSSGTSLDGVTLVLQGVDSSGRMGGFHSPVISVRPNEDGTFEFSGVPPGSYVLSAGLERMEDGRRRYLTTFFPGTRDAAAAIPIVIGRATQHDGFDFLVTTE